MLYSIILACTLDGGIGYENNIPWDIKSEMNLFREITTAGTTDYKKMLLLWEEGHGNHYLINL